ncbi:hypothetical protein E4K67_23250 [Desulfosporosinus fructosivorans]|uniref:Uncharacterized protein n=1 Tax=Desulfosporosinus fructosivorans TaxID=2018669 RepID=A0A4Z0R201_9FIRM|nr:hypothetical protein [Desulfosporosinus fructosivorans]TGE36027.1 hypothetical protein E4K67_23250 [Desulfosporosinus fructosivorans]
MKKAIFSLCCVILLLLVTPVATFAADSLYRMLYADEVESFKQDQDAMIVGQLTGKQGDKYNVKVLKVLSGKVSSDMILVSDDFTYGWDHTPPMVNDFSVFSLKKSGDFYKKAWGIFRANSGDYRTLELESLNCPIPWLLGDLACIQWYVNSEGKEKDFFGHSGTMYVRRPNGQEVQIYPVPTVHTETATSVNAQNQIRNSPTIKDSIWSNSLSYVLSIIVVILIGIGTAVFARSRKGKVK